MTASVTTPAHTTPTDTTPTHTAPDDSTVTADSTVTEAPTGPAVDVSDAEFERQVQTLVDAGYPSLAGLDETAFRTLLAPLREEARRGARPLSAPERIPFAIVVTSALVTADRALPALHWRSTTGWTEFTAAELAAFRAIPEVDVPDAPVYLIADVDTGAATLDIRARDALPLILGAGRTPLTVDEGVSLLALFPAILEERNAFFLPGSRCGDKRVTALWVSKGHPRLGWCWEGNPHTWLGSASAADRRSA